MEECFEEDPANAMGLVERRNAKWGNMDCLELALKGQGEILQNVIAFCK